ncbi:hypothetical protein AB6A40_009228 [Gnathostoma spinigerum]|uniref:Uncharacterized protein n=1 Tax=Gnathostoma spinigerum TaxID=75299 RepID=A0ABD6EZ32_9BILA
MLGNRLAIVPSISSRFASFDIVVAQLSSEHFTEDLTDVTSLFFFSNLLEILQFDADNSCSPDNPELSVFGALTLLSRRYLMLSSIGSIYFSGRRNASCYTKFEWVHDVDTICCSVD